MRKEPMGLENHNKAEQEPFLRSAKEEQLVIGMILELSCRFDLRQAHEVASVLKISHEEAKSLLALAAAKTCSV